MYVCMYVYIYTYACTYACIYERMYIMYVRRYVCKRACVCLCACVCCWQRVRTCPNKRLEYESHGADAASCRQRRRVTSRGGRGNNGPSIPGLARSRHGGNADTRPSGLVLGERPACPTLYGAIKWIPGNGPRPHSHEFLMRARKSGARRRQSAGSQSEV